MSRIMKLTTYIKVLLKQLDKKKTCSIKGDSSCTQTLLEFNFFRGHKNTILPKCLFRKTFKIIIEEIFQTPYGKV